MASALQAQASLLHESTSSFTLHPRRHLGILFIFLLFSASSYVALASVALPINQPIMPFMLVWGLCFLVYLMASLWIMASRRASRRFLWAELGIIFVGAVIFRVMLINLPLGLSPDAWRYLWDARMIVHGYSPYQYAPSAPLLAPLRDAVYAHSAFRNTPTKYPPGAELFFLLGYLLSSTKLIGLKIVFVLCDLVTCIALMALLAYKKRDPRYALLYAWCPLPIVEFAIQSHVDVTTITFTVLAVLCAVGSKQPVRVLAGVMIGLAVLTKLYPIILLLVLVRRRDWGLLIACAITIVLGYLPFVLLGHGNLLGSGGPIAAITSQREAHIGVVQNVLFIAGMNLHIARNIMQPVVDAVEALIIGTTLIVVVLGRLRGRMSTELGVLILTAVTLTIYAHIFPWYATALLPWIPLCIVPIWSRKGLSAKGLAVTMLWYFTCTCILSYIPGLREYATQANWLIYYAVTFGVVLIGLLVAMFIVLQERRLFFVNKGVRY